MRKTGIVILSLMLVLSLAALTGSQAAADNPAIASISTEQIFQAHPAIQWVQAELQEKQSEMMQELEEADEEEAMMLQQQMQTELQTLQQELLDEAFEEIEKDVGIVAAELGYDVVIDPQGIVYGADVLDLEDITEEVLEFLEEE